MTRLRESEADFQRAVIEWAQRSGWRVAHFRTARTKDGWRTPVEADGEGFLDLTMTRRGRLIFAELKSDRGRLTIAQKLWLADLQLVEHAATPYVEVHVWRPRDWPVVRETLR